MTNPNDKDNKPANVFSKRLRIGLLIIGAIFVFQGLSQLNKSFFGNKDTKPATVTTTSETSPNSGADYSQVGPQFKDPNGSLTLNYPADWKVAADPRPNNPFQASAEGGVVDFRISKEPLDQDITPKQYVEAMDKIFKTDPKVKTIDKLGEELVTINGNECIKRTHTMMLANKEILIKQMFLVLVKDRVAYCAVATTPVDIFEKTKPTFDKVYQSVRFE
ncbi:hypothetical protein KA183_14445 [bacterium]|nr:hypothetical protein [bacterium]